MLHIYLGIGFSCVVNTMSTKHKLTPSDISQTFKARTAILDMIKPLEIGRQLMS